MTGTGTRDPTPIALASFGCGSREAAMVPTTAGAMRWNTLPVPFLGVATTLVEDGAWKAELRPLDCKSKICERDDLSLMVFQGVLLQWIQ